MYACTSPTDLLPLPAPCCVHHLMHAQMLQPPTKADGFERIYTVASFDEASALLSSLGAQPPVGVAPLGPPPRSHRPWEEGWQQWEEQGEE